MTTECVTVSTKIPKPLKEKMIKLKIKPSKLLRKAIEDEIKRKEIEEVKDEIDRLKPIFDKISIERTIVKEHQRRQGQQMKYMFDASAIFRAIKRKQNWPPKLEIIH